MKVEIDIGGETLRVNGVLISLGLLEGLTSTESVGHFFQVASNKDGVVMLTSFNPEVEAKMAKALEAVEGK